MSIDGMLAAGPIVQPKVQMNLVELITIAERSTRYVNGMTSVIVHREHHTVASVGQNTSNLVLVQVKGLQIRVKEKPGGLQVYR